MNGLGAMLPNPADVHLTRIAQEGARPGARSGANSAAARFATVLAAARSGKALGPLGEAPGAADAGPDADDALTKDEKRFLEEIAQPLRARAQECESFLYLQALTAMRRMLRPRDNILHGGPAEETYSLLLDLERAKLMADREPSSLAEKLTRQLLTEEQRGQLEAIREKLSRQGDALLASGLKRPMDGPK